MSNHLRTNQLREAADNSGALDYSFGWNLLRHEFLYLLWALMELALLTPLLLAFAPWTRFWPPGLIVALLLLMMLIPFNISRLMSTLEIDVERQRIVLAVALLITVLIAWRLLLYSPRSAFDVGWFSDLMNHMDMEGNPFLIRDVTIFLVVALMWWRGISLHGRHVDIGEIGFRMRFEILFLFFLVAVIAGALLPQSVMPFILLFIFSSLLAIVITRVEQLELGRSGQAFPISLRWLLIVTGAAALITFATGALAGLLSNETVNQALGWFSPIWEAINHLAVVVVAIITYLMSPLIIFLSWLFGLLTSALAPALQGPLDELELITQPPVSEQFPEELLQASETAIQFPRQLLTILIMIFVVLFVTLALGRMIRTLRRVNRSEVKAINPMADLGSLQKPNLGQRLLDRFGAFRRWRAAASIRHLYRQMCAEAADHGYPRAQSETPYEYLQTLALAWPENVGDTVLITEAYVRVHYGEFPESKEELSKIETAWNRLESKQLAVVEPTDDGLSLRRH